MKKLLTFFTMLVSLLCLPLTASAWFVNANGPGNLIGEDFADVNGNTINTWSASSTTGIKLTWVSSASMSQGVFRATKTTAKMRIAVSTANDGKSTYDGLAYDGSYDVSAISGYRTNGFSTKDTYIKVNNLVVGKLYCVNLQAWDNGGSINIRIRPLPDKLYLFGSAAGNSSSDTPSTSNSKELPHDGQGKYTFSGSLSNTGNYFKVSSGANGWNNSDGINPNGVTAIEKFEDGKSYAFGWPVTAGDSKVESTGNWTIIYDFVTCTVKSFKEIPYLYIRDSGVYNSSNDKINYFHDANGNNLSTQSNFPVIKGANNVFEFELSTTGASYFKLATKSSDNTYIRIPTKTISGAGEQDITLDQAEYVNNDASSIDPQIGGIWKFKVDLSTGKISYTWQEDHPADPVINYVKDDNKWSVSCSTEGASIYYTTNGDTPTKDNGTLYQGEVTVQKGQSYTLKAIAYKNEKYSDNFATVDDVSYQPHLPAVPEVKVDPVSNTAEITCEGNPTVYYTTDGTNPANSATRVQYVYGTTIPVPATGFLSGIWAVAENADGYSANSSDDSAPQVAVVKYQLKAPTIQVDDATGKFTITNTNAGIASVVWSTDKGKNGIFPDAFATVTVTETTTLTAHAEGSNMLSSASVSATWKDGSVQVVLLNVSTNQEYSFTKTSNGSYTLTHTFKTVTLGTESGNDFYCLKLTYADGSVKYGYIGNSESSHHVCIWPAPQNDNDVTFVAPTGSDDRSQAIRMANSFSDKHCFAMRGATAGNNVMQKLIVTLADGENPDVAKLVFTDKFGPDAPVIAFEAATNEVSITCLTAGASIYYTTDGSDPKSSASRTQYAAPFTLSEGESFTVRAVAYDASDYSDEATPLPVAFQIPAPTIEVVQEGDKYFAVITNVYGKGQMTYTVDGRSSTAEAPDDTQVKVELTASCSISAYVTAFGVGTSATASTTWENPADKKPIYLVQKTTGWDPKSPMEISWDAALGAYKAIITFADIRDGYNTFKISKNTGADSSGDGWTEFNNGAVYATLKSDSSDWINLTKGTADSSVDTNGNWTIYINGDLSQIRAEWEPVNPDVNRVGWSLTTAADWKDKTSRFFYLSGEQNDSRVSPEWEFVEHDGSWTLDNFMVVPAGQFIVREITRDASGNFGITDWAYGDNAYQVKASVLGLPSSQAEEREYAVRVRMKANADRGFFWNIGYTMANLKIERTAPRPAENGTDKIIYYKHNTSSTYQSTMWMYIYGESNGYTEHVQMTKDEATGWFYYVLSADQASKADRVIFETNDSFGNKYPSGNNEPGLEISSAGSKVLLNNGSIEDYASASTKPSITLPAGMDITLGADFTQPSTLAVAPNPGMPYVALMGEIMATAKGDEQEELDYIANIKNNGAPFIEGSETERNNTGFTNGYVYHDEQGRVVRYGDSQVATRKGTRNGSQTELYFLRGAKANMNSYSGTTSTGDYDIAVNRAIYSTRQPSVYPLNFSGVYKHEAISMSSTKAVLDYKGVVEKEFVYGSGANQKTKTIKVAHYTTKNVNMLGKLKLFSGHGGRRYGSVYNGLSMHTNWGVGAASGDAYASEKATPDYDLPLSGAGALHELEEADETERGENIISDKYTTGDGHTVSYSYEDNAAGKYFYFDKKTYVTSLDFYFALEADDKGDEHDVDAVADDKINHNKFNERPTNSGRNYSWLRLNYGSSSEKVLLDKTGAAEGTITYSINEGMKEADAKEIISYQVWLYKVDSNNDEDRVGKQIWTSGAKEGNGAVKVPNTYYSQDDLETGWYQAFIEVMFKDEDEPQTAASDKILIFQSAGKPSLSAKQIINQNVDGTKEYTLDVALSSDLRTFCEANVDDNNEPRYTEIRAELTIPVALYQEVQYEKDGKYQVAVSGSDGFTLSADKRTWTYAITTNNHLTEDNTALPNIKVKNTLPGEKLSYTIVAYVQGAGDSKRPSSTANVTIVAPRAQYVGEAEFAANWNGDFDGYTSVKVADGRFVLRDHEDQLKKATIAPATLEDYTLSFGVDYSDKGGATKTFTVNPAPADKATLADADKASVAAPADYLPYYPAEKDGENVPADQEYDFATTLTYVRTADTKSASVAQLPGDVTTTHLTLNTPREGLSDKKPSEKPDFINDDDFKKGETLAKDYVRIMTTWQEKWGGVNNQVEDALIAADIVQPTANTVFRFDADNQKINHHAMSVFNPANHLVSDNPEDGTHYQAPGYGVDGDDSFWALHEITSKAQHKERHPYFEERVGRGWTGAGDIVIESAQAFASDKFYFWAGCKPNDAATGDADKYLNVKDGNGWTRVVEYKPRGNKSGGWFDKADGFMGYYGSRNHHARQGWKGGELFSRDWFVQAFAKTANNAATTSVSVATLIQHENNPFDDPADANAVLAKIKEYIISGTGLPLYDSKIVKDKNSLEFGKEIYLAAFDADPTVNNATANHGRVMLKVNHVNHESWYGYNGSVLEQWENDKTWSWGADVKTFEDKLDYIRIFPKYYTPVTYDFSYDYPVLASADYATLGGAAAQAKLAKVRTANDAASGETTVAARGVKVVTARATGLIAFEDAANDKGDIPTAIESVGADAGGANGRYFRYSRDTKTLTVTSTEGVGAVTVATVDGRLLKSADGNGSETFTVSLADLADGYYAVIAEGVGSIKILK